FRKFILTGTDIGSYGIDVGTNFPNLLKKILEIDGKYIVTLNDMNPRWLVKYYEEISSILKENSEKVSKIILPVQSASNRILELMNRQYTIDEVNKCIMGLHERIPSIDLETHIIVGFPSETEEDFCKSLEFVKGSIFSKVWVYQYNDRPGTVASKLVPKISDKVIKEREKRLSQVANIR
ncbi:MAG: radical SAM protein, partial [Candidatus Bathyarchaeota archaeon]